MRTVSLTFAKGELCSPEELDRRFTEAGFRFDRKGCPFKLSQPWRLEEHEDGSATYIQEQADA